MMIKRMCAGALCAVLLLGLAGCSEEETILDPPAPPTVYGSSSDLMLAFKIAYEARDADMLAKVLDPGFEFVLDQQTQDEFPSVGATLDFAAELRVADRMFLGGPVTSPGGYLIPGISAIDFQEFRQLGEWNLIEPSLGEFNDYRAVFQVGFLLSRPGFLDFVINGQLGIDARAWPAETKGEESLSWKIIGMVDQTGPTKSQSEQYTWGEVKALFWVPEPLR